MALVIFLLVPVVFLAVLVILSARFYKKNTKMAEIRYKVEGYKQSGKTAKREDF